jgi:hypothetical protein
MAELVYVLCAATSALCALLLGRAYARTRARLLLWSTLCFVFLAINNLLLVVDLMVLPEIDLSLLRAGGALVAMILLIVGLVWESR